MEGKTVAEVNKSTKKSIKMSRKPETVRQRSEKALKKSVTGSRKLATPKFGVSKITNSLKKEYHPIKLGSSKTAVALTKKRSSLPGYVLDSFRESKQIQWPSFKQALRLTFAVFAFSVVFASLVRGIDYGFERLFKDVILK